MTAAAATTETLYTVLSREARNLELLQWLPAAINRRGNLPATPRRLAWAIRVLSAGAYPSRRLAEAMSSRQADGGRELAASVAACCM